MDKNIDNTDRTSNKSTNPFISKRNCVKDTHNMVLSDYKDTYAHVGIHEDMIKDKERTNTYRNAIYNNTHLFRNKIVLDIGCGTGILSMFAAKAGAAKVIAIERSSIVKYAKRVVADNKLDHIITVVEGNVEEIELPDGISKVDIIISEWMGYCLFYECMLNTIIYARDMWLKKEGILFPDRATLYIAAIEDSYYKTVKLNWFNDMYGFNMNALKKATLREPFINIINPSQVVTNAYILKTVNLYTVTIEDLIFDAPFNLQAFRKDCVHAFITFFTVQFTKCHKHTGFSTAPDCPLTHWMQTIFYLNKSIFVNTYDEISGVFSIVSAESNSQRQYMDFVIDVKFNNGIDKLFESNKYHLQ